MAYHWEKRANRTKRKLQLAFSTPELVFYVVLLAVYFLVFRMSLVIMIITNSSCDAAMGVVHVSGTTGVPPLISTLTWLAIALAGFWMSLCFSTWPKIQQKSFVTSFLRFFEMAVIAAFAVMVMQWSIFTKIAPPDAVIMVGPPILSEKAWAVWPHLSWQSRYRAPYPTCVWIEEGKISDPWPDATRYYAAIEKWADLLDDDPQAVMPVWSEYEAPIRHKRIKSLGLFQLVPAPVTGLDTRPATDEEIELAKRARVGWDKFGWETP